MSSPHRRTFRTTLAHLMLSGLLGCELFEEPIVCTTEARPSVAVFVRDAVSEQFIGGGATLVLRDGAFADSVTAPDSDAYNSNALIAQNSFERAGTFSVTVRKPAYADWDTTGVVVLQGRCHVSTVTLTADLQPL